MPHIMVIMLCRLTYLSCVVMQDALRLYLINSPVVRAESLKFKKDGVYGVVSGLLSYLIIAHLPPYIKCTEC